MLSSATFDLRRQPTWNPAQLIVASFSWPGSYPQMPLGELASMFVAQSFVEIGAEVITPGGIDRRNGGIRRRSQSFQGAAYLVGSDLAPGDLLVSSSAHVPVLMISEQYAGAAVSTAFQALRPTDASAYWLWAVLNSRSGQALRAAMAVGRATPKLTRQALTELPIPLPTLREQRELEPALRGHEETTRIEEEETPATWWRIADLRDADWRFETSFRDPDLLNSGEPLADLCGEIVTGRAQLNTAAAEEPGDGLLPVTEIAVLGGKAPRRWVSPDERAVTIANAGDVLVAGVGERAQAVVATESSAVHRNVFVLRLRNPAIAQPLARFLNSTEGYRLRQMFLAGAVIPTLRKTDLARFPVPPRVLEESFDEIGPQEPLADRLEQVLWQD